MSGIVEHEVIDSNPCWVSTQGSTVHWQIIRHLCGWDDHLEMVSCLQHRQKITSEDVSIKTPAVTVMWWVGNKSLFNWSMLITGNPVYKIALQTIIDNTL